MHLEFSGYGGEYCCGKISNTEKENIKELLKRFDSDLIIGSFETGFSENGIDSYYEFDSEYAGSSVANPTHITVYDNNIELESFVSDTIDNINFESVLPLSDGFYLVSQSFEKGLFFSAELPSNVTVFDKNKLEIIYSDLSNCNIDDQIVSRVFYDGKKLELNYDILDTVGKEFYQDLIYVEDGLICDGISEIVDTIDDNSHYEIIDDVYNFDRPEVLSDYLTILNAAKKGKMLNFDTATILFASNILYEYFDKNDVDEALVREENIKFMLKNNCMHLVPNYIFDIVEARFPEWLI